jgi:glycerophosphoryl diester phosphodiesterase
MIPKIYGHRGASAYAPENTMAAFQLAIEHNADGFELDVMLSNDGEVVVIHDDTVDRTTNGTGRVKDLTLDELRALDAGDGEKIPTLAEVFEKFGDRVLVNIELKNYSSIFDSLPVKVANLVNSFNLEQSLLVSSFNPFNLPRFAKRLPEIKLGLITMPNKAQHWLWRMFRYDALNPQYTDVDRTLVAALHAQNRAVNVWTVDDPDEIRRLAALNVDGIITNDPRLARDILESSS